MLTKVPEEASKVAELMEVVEHKFNMDIGNCGGRGDCGHYGDHGGKSDCGGCCDSGCCGDRGGCGDCGGHW